MGPYAAEIDRVFVLRFWREAAGDVPDAARWRARITDVNSQRQFHTEGLEGAFNAIRSFLCEGEANTGKP